MTINIELKTKFIDIPLVETSCERRSIEKLIEIFFVKINQLIMNQIKMIKAINDLETKK